MKVCAIIQARMGSTRLPEKAMLDIEGQPMLWHVVNRLKQCAQLNDIIVATTLNEEDQCIEEYCKHNNISCFRGSSEDVLDRYYQAAEFYGADVIVRITSDCPLIDPEIVDCVVTTYLENQDEYVGASSVVDRTFPRGLDCEVFSFEALAELHETVSEDRYREHVTLYMYDHQNEYPLVNVVHHEDLSGYRLTVDEPDDFQLITAIYKGLYKEGCVFGLNDVMDYLTQNPKLKSINAQVKQKVYK